MLHHIHVVERMLSWYKNQRQIKHLTPSQDVSAVII